MALFAPPSAPTFGSGHDWSVTPLLMCLVARDDPNLSHWPPFCSNIVFELWSTREADASMPRQLSHPACIGGVGAHEAQRHVRVLYNGQPVKLRCAPTRETCTLAEFKAMIEPFCVRDFVFEGRARAGEAKAATSIGFNAQTE